MKHTILIMLTLDIGDRNLHDVQEAILDKFPEKFGKIEVFDTRIVGGLVDKDEVPVVSKDRENLITDHIWSSHSIRREKLKSFSSKT